jgi:glycosyltransferase involved in cell wall biosynthesis
MVTDFDLRWLMAAASTAGVPSLLVFADDWGRHPSSCQHLISDLLTRYEVFWVNTIGTRQPRLDWTTLARGAEKVRHWLSPAASRGIGDSKQPIHPRLHVLNPWMWPSFGSAVERFINRHLLVRQLTEAISAMPEPPIAVTNIPIVADLIGTLPVRRWVYYCVDDFAEWPGLDGTTLRAMEDRLIHRADVLIAVSATLQEKLEQHRRPVRLLTHGVDLEHWQAGVGQAPKSTTKVLDGLEPPLIVFWGVVDRRMDFAFIERLAQDLELGTIVLIGPESDPDPRLSRLPRVMLRPPVPFDQLPDIARAADVLIMPYADLPVTRAMQPLKLKEYLATGKPVVARKLPSTEPWADALDIADSPESFSQAVRNRLESGLPAAHHCARARLADESWSVKAIAFDRWLMDDVDDEQPSMAGLARLTEVCS